MAKKELPEGWTKVEHWTSRLSPSTTNKNASTMRMWMTWVREHGGRFKDYTPDDLVRFQAEASNGEKFSILDEVIQPFIDQTPGRIGYKAKLYSSIRSFFVHNRAELPRDPSFRVRPTTPKVAGSLKPEELKHIILSCKPMYQAVYLCMFQAGMGEEEFAWWNANGWEELKPQLDEGKSTIKVTLPGRKKRRFEENYFTYIGDDAVKALRSYVDGHRHRGSAIFPNRYGEPLSKNAVYLYWLRHLRKLGLIGVPVKGVKTYRTGKNPHELRDTFRTLWAMSGAAPHIAEALMGHVTDELGYDKSAKNEKYALEEYRKALRFLNIMSSSRAMGQVNEEEVEALRAKVEQLQTQKDTRMEALEKEVQEMRAILKAIYENPAIAQKKDKS